MIAIYVVALVPEDKALQRELIVDAIREGEWYTSAIGAGASMEQFNQFILEKISKEAYDNGQFILFGVHKMTLTELVTNYGV